jgi:hypothetical protein
MKSYEYDDDGTARLSVVPVGEPIRKAKGRRRRTYMRRSFGEWFSDSRMSFAIWFGLIALAALFWCPLSRVL